MRCGKRLQLLRVVVELGRNRVDRLLKPLDRQVIISYLEGIEAASISEITGLSPENVAMRIHRIKNVLAKWFREGGKNAR